MTLQLKICRDVGGTWSVHGLSHVPVSHLPSLSASVDYAKRECAAAPAIFEVIVDGLCLRYFQDAGWQHRIVASAAAPRGTGLWSRALGWLRRAPKPDCPHPGETHSEPSALTPG
jgi:hypothetical protein